MQVLLYFLTRMLLILLLKFAPLLSGGPLIMKKDPKLGQH